MLFKIDSEEVKDKADIMKQIEKQQDIFQLLQEGINIMKQKLWNI